MTEETASVPCPNCRAPIAVPPEWRLARCPNCGAVATRMETDPSYD